MEALARVPIDYLPQLEFIDEQKEVRGHGQGVSGHSHGNEL